jgi:hypothetical protein
MDLLSSYALEMRNHELNLGQNNFTLGRKRITIYHDILIYEKKLLKAK